MSCNTSTYRKRYRVGRVDGKPMYLGVYQKQFSTEENASLFIATLPDHEQGVYYLDDMQEELKSLIDTLEEKNDHWEEGYPHGTD